jgi:hypothetical protein
MRRQMQQKAMQQQGGRGVTQFMIGQRMESIRPGTIHMSERPYISPFTERRTEWGGAETIGSFGFRQSETPFGVVQQFGVRKPYVPPAPEEQKPYAPDAPKFVYKRKPGSFTRKSSRLVKGDDPSPGETSEPSKKKRGGSRYPWTKPMQDWERVYVGRGKPAGKGRQKRSKVPTAYATHESIDKSGLRRKFVPHVETYGYDPKLKYKN